MKIIEYSILFDERADYNINQVKNYISYILNNPIAAINTATGLKKQISILKYFPQIGTIYNQNYSNLRFLIYKNYLIFYEIQEYEKLIIIKTIMHKRQSRTNLN